MPGTTGTIPLQSAIPDELITSALWNAEFANVGALMDAIGAGGYSATDAQMQIQTNPNPGGVLSHATSLAGELERLRYVIAQIIGKTNWTDSIPNGNNLGSVFITGEIRQIAFTSIPTGFLECDGSAVSRTTYATLFAAIGTTWGAGDASTTFNLPDLRGRTLIGAGTGSGLTARTVGQQTIGEETHVLTTAELAAHTHSLTDPGHVHAVTDPGHTHAPLSPSTTFTSQHAGGSNYQETNGAFTDERTATTASATTGLTVNSHTIGIAATDSNGSGTAHNNMQPSAVVKFIIKT